MLLLQHRSREMQSDNLKTLLRMIARIEALGKDSGSEYEGTRDIEQLRKILSDGMPPCSKYAFTDHVRVQICELKKSIRTRTEVSSYIGIGAAIITSHEIAFTTETINLSMELSGFDLYLDERLCVYPRQEVTICQNGAIRKGYIAEVLEPHTKKTLAEKLMEDCELITGENLAILIPREFLAKLEAEPYSSHSSDNLE
ncbi:unnamed protein product [Cylicocyclus nassatus]|uniref:Uncharacterized protein n=1 Tax=Cylicocyclus nassatus TaxID=53992 RepID=A0AA36GRY4_CYLNA|nr:unnamed protein product [Cylicocyclus nassatus]